MMAGEGENLDLHESLFHLDAWLSAYDQYTLHPGAPWLQVSSHLSPFKMSPHFKLLFFLFLPFFLTLLYTNTATLEVAYHYYSYDRCCVERGKSLTYS
uniref:Uncharacterized protein n=1 Tax=Octopus bimaculoides TaxID=37653 RepID=A0A0L8GLX9_OCTBM